MYFDIFLMILDDFDDFWLYLDDFGWYLDDFDDLVLYVMYDSVFIYIYISFLIAHFCRHCCPNTRVHTHWNAMNLSALLFRWQVGLLWCRACMRNSEQLPDRRRTSRRGDAYWAQRWLSFSEAAFRKPTECLVQSTCSCHNRSTATVAINVFRGGSGSRKHSPDIALSFWTTSYRNWRFLIQFQWSYTLMPGPPASSFGRDSASSLRLKQITQIPCFQQCYAMKNSGDSLNWSKPPTQLSDCQVESTERLRRLETTRGTVDMKTFRLSTGSELSGQKDAVQMSQTIGTWPAEAWMNKSRTEMDGAGSIFKNPTAQLNALDLGFATFCWHAMDVTLCNYYTLNTQQTRICIYLYIHIVHRYEILQGCWCNAFILRTAFCCFHLACNSKDEHCCSSLPWRQGLGAVEDRWYVEDCNKHLHASLKQQWEHLHFSAYRDALAPFVALGFFIPRH